MHTTRRMGVLLRGECRTVSLPSLNGHMRQSRQQVIATTAPEGATTRALPRLACSRASTSGRQHGARHLSTLPRLRDVLRRAQAELLIKLTPFHPHCPVNKDLVLCGVQTREPPERTHSYMITWKTLRCLRIAWPSRPESPLAPPTIRRTSEHMHILRPRRGRTPRLYATTILSLPGPSGLAWGGLRASFANVHRDMPTNE